MIGLGIFAKRLLFGGTGFHSCTTRDGNPYKEQINEPPQLKYQQAHFSEGLSRNSLTEANLDEGE